jgi:preprotein translocase subunit SecE
MKAKETAISDSENRFDSARWFVAAIVVFASIYSYHHFETVFVAYRLLALLPIIAIVGYLLLRTDQGSRFWLLMRESSLEAKRVVWPTRQETTQTTLIVVAVIFVTGILLWLLDVALNWLTSIVMG